MKNYIVDNYDIVGGDLNDAVVNYLKTVVGINDRTIESIRCIMIENYHS